MQQKIQPFLWFDTQAEEAARFYVSVFKEDSKVLEVVRYPPGGPGPEGSVMTVTFELRGQRFIALNGGPHFTFSEAVSFVVHCADQPEVDHFWEALTADGGQESMCGWVKDRYGLSWQVVPTRALELWTDPDPARKARAFKAMMTMKKLDLAALERAADGK
jgi:predicted 3-demethylubiquinone-9 3-methyltransferase (glyoxalase superfamily)